MTDKEKQEVIDALKQLETLKRLLLKILNK